LIIWRFDLVRFSPAPARLRRARRARPGAGRR